MHGLALFISSKGLLDRGGDYVHQFGNAEMALDNLGTTSLGHLLFRNPQIQRGPIEISRYPAAWLPTAWRAEGLWARRSHFSDGALQLLVCEVFLQGWPAAGT